MSDETRRYPKEDFESYFVRLFTNKSVYGLTCEQIADLLNTEKGTTWGESKWRKQFAAFSQGMRYQREHGGSDMFSASARELEKQRIRLADERAALKRILREDARKNSLLDIVKDGISGIEPIQPCGDGISPCQSGGTMLVVLSDLHIGMDVDNDKGVYNTEIARRRIAEYAEQVIESVETFGARKIVVALAGDIVNGLIHRSVSVELKERIVRQLEIGAEIISWFIVYVSGCVESVEVYSVSGNHSRVTDRDDYMMGEGLDNLVPYYVRMRVEASAPDRHIKVHCDETDYGYSDFCISGLNCVVVHGDIDAMNERGIAKIERFVGHSIDLVVCGHLHEDLFKDVMGVTVLQGGCLCGSADNYCTRNRLTCKPSQIMAYIDADGKLSYVRPVYFK